MPTMYEVIAFKMSGHIYTFFAIFTKGGNFPDFLFASVEDKALPNRIYS